TAASVVLTYDPAILTYVSATTPLTGSQNWSPPTISSEQNGAFAAGSLALVTGIGPSGAPISGTTPVQLFDIDFLTAGPGTSPINIVADRTTTPNGLVSTELAWGNGQPYVLYPAPTAGVDPGVDGSVTVGDSPHEPTSTTVASSHNP